MRHWSLCTVNSKHYNYTLNCFCPFTGQCDVNITHDSTLNRTIKWQPTVAGQTAQSFERCTLSTINGKSSNNQSMNQSTNQPISQSINQSIN